MSLLSKHGNFLRLLKGAQDYIDKVYVEEEITYFSTEPDWTNFDNWYSREEKPLPKDGGAKFSQKLDVPDAPKEGHASGETFKCSSRPNYTNRPSLEDISGLEDDDSDDDVDFSVRPGGTAVAASGNMASREEIIVPNDVKYSLSGKDLLGEYYDRYDSEAIDRAISSQIGSRNMSALNDALEQSVNQTFVERVIALIRVKDVKDSAVYKAAQLDRRLFSKMMSDRCYKPSKDTAVAIALALQLPLTQANDLISRAGYTFSHSDKRDVVIEYFFRERIFNITDINLVLHKLGLKLIGR